MAFCTPGTRQQMNMKQQHLYLSVFAALLTACGSAPDVRSTAEARAVEVTWEAEILQSHPLTGRIYSSRKGAFVSAAEMTQALRNAPVVLIGERHDHPDHHRLQGWILSRLDPEAVVGFEMLDELDVDPIADVQTADALRAASKWDESGWPDFTLYRPVFDALYAAGHTAAAVHPSRKRLRDLMMGPASQATENRDLATSLSEDGLAALRRDITKGHCGHATPPIVEAMILAQRFKDRWMTTRLKEAANGKQAVLIAGNGHIRRDYGVPNDYDAPVMSVALLEVRRDRETPAEYTPELYDWVWFTPRIDEIDPCEKFKAQLEKIRKKAHSKAEK